MKKIICLLLLICVVLSIFSFVFLNDEKLSFEDTYSDTLEYVKDIGAVFEPLKNVASHARVAVGFIHTIIGYGVETLNLFINTAISLPTIIRDNVGSVINSSETLRNIVDTLGSVVDKVVEVRDKIKDSVKDAFEYIWDTIADFLGICSECGKLLSKCEGHYEGAGPGGSPGSSGGGGTMTEIK